ncbi:MAG: hypothetical protein WCF33_00475 [Pseudonocardiaceae bacterium]
MNERDAERLAVVVAEEWVQVSPPFLGDATSPDADPGEPRVGAYWPIGFPVPVRGNSFRSRVSFIAAKALGTSLLFCFTLDAQPQQYLLCFDLARTPADDLRVASGAVFTAVMRLLGRSNWEETQQGVLPVSHSLTIVLPAN